LISKYRQVIAYCKTHQIDLLHCHLPWAGFLGRLVHAKTKIPVLYSEHNMQERYHVVTKILNRYSFNSQSLALGVSEDVSKSIKKNIDPRIPVKTLLNGVNTDSFKPGLASEVKMKLGIPETAKVMGNIAVFRFQKRIVEWLRVFKSIQQENPDVHGIIVGAGPLEEKIFTECRKLGLTEKVHFPGLKTNVKPYLEVMDIFMMSSSFEGLPIALLEAMSMECAIISTNAGGIKEVIRHEKDGLICDVVEWQKLSDLAQTLIKDPSKLDDLKLAARKRVVENFSLKGMVKELEKYYIETFDAKYDLVR
jgi:L-malate glycosyltransferase